MSAMGLLRLLQVDVRSGPKAHLRFAASAGATEASIENASSHFGRDHLGNLGSFR